MIHPIERSIAVGVDRISNGLRRPSIGLTSHAITRVLERLAISPPQVAELLGEGLYVDVGTEPGTRKQHRLFYSPRDGFCFVAIHDVSNGEVVTVLPLSYHEQLAWPITPQQEQAARALMLPQSGRFSTKPQHYDPALSNARTFRVMAYASKHGAALRAINLGTWPCVPYGRRVERLLEDETFAADVRSRIESILFEDEGIEGVYVRLGKEGPAKRIAMQPVH